MNKVLISILALSCVSVQVPVKAIDLSALSGILTRGYENIKVATMCSAMCGGLGHIVAKRFFGQEPMMGIGLTLSAAAIGFSLPCIFKYYCVNWRKKVTPQNPVGLDEKSQSEKDNVLKDNNDTPVPSDHSSFENIKNTKKVISKEKNNEEPISKSTDVEKDSGEGLGINNLEPDERESKHRGNIMQQPDAVKDVEGIASGDDKRLHLLEFQRKWYERNFPGQKRTVDEKAEAFLINLLKEFEGFFGSDSQPFKLEPYYTKDRVLLSWTNIMLCFRSEPNFCRGKMLKDGNILWFDKNSRRLGLDKVFMPQNLPNDFVAWAKSATQRYKIHLMPFKQDIPIILYRLVDEIRKNPILQKSISEFKFCLNMPSFKSGGAHVPTIIIYPGPGKEAAQAVLNAIYALFDDMEGLDACPRWNKKVTSLIYWAQGDGQFKNTYAHLFEEGDAMGNGRACYRPDITGEPKEYHLDDPRLVKNKNKNENV